MALFPKVSSSFDCTHESQYMLYYIKGSCCVTLLFLCPNELKWSTGSSEMLLRCSEKHVEVEVFKGHKFDDKFNLTLKWLKQLQQLKWWFYYIWWLYIYTRIQFLMDLFVFLISVLFSLSMTSLRPPFISCFLLRKQKIGAAIYLNM